MQLVDDVSSALADENVKISSFGISSCKQKKELVEILKLVLKFITARKVVTFKFSQSNERSRNCQFVLFGY